MDFLRLSCCPPEDVSIGPRIDEVGELRTFSFQSDALRGAHGSHGPLSAFGDTKKDDA